MATSSPQISVDLIPDAGKSSCDPGEFFRCPEFFAAEGVTHSLQVSGQGPAVPLLVRDIPDTDLQDAISPYGYPGAKGGFAEPVEASGIDWSHLGLVSILIRDSIGVEPVFSDGVERVRVWVSDPSQPIGMRKRLREQVRRNERSGWVVSITPGPEVLPSQVVGFSRAYAETMVRTEALDRFRFDDTYFETLFGSDSSWLVTASIDDEIKAGAILVRSDGLLHYYLGGTVDAALSESPMKNLFAAMIEFSGETELPLNFGGGISPGDSLNEFKQRFANTDLPFTGHGLICDPASYDRLTAGLSKEVLEGWFPAYRAPG